MPYVNSRGVVMRESAPEEARVVGTAAGGETINAPAGNSSLSGEGGGDVLIGNSFDNRHWITNPNDRVIEQPGGGIDTEIGWTSIKLAPNVENLTVHGDFNYAFGNELDNLIVVDGAQWVYGAAGDDVLVGSTQARTTFLVRAGEGSDVIYNWQGNSQLQLVGYGFTSGDQIRAAMRQDGADVVLDLHNGETLTFRGATTGAFADRQFLLPLDASKLGALTFADEFDTLKTWDPSLETGFWRTNFGGNLKDQWAYTLVSNGETQVYAAPGFQGRGEGDLGINPFSIDNGVLSITARPIAAEDAYAAWNRDYSSGMLNTLGVFEQKYGYFEIRAELPQAAGTWPAFWMMTHPFTAGVEADIFEGLAATPNVDYRRAFGGDQTLYDNALKIDPTGFHTYGLLWTPSTVTFYYDGYAVLQGPTPANWDQPMAMILNMAVGGWGGNPDPSAFPATLKVDYIHAYALSDGSTQVVRETPEAPAATLRLVGGPTSGQVNAPVTFEDSGQAVTSAHIAVYDARPAALPAGRSFVIWEDSGAVFGAVSDGSSLGQATPLMAGSTRQFTGTGTWLSNGKLVFGYMMPDGSGQAAWAMVFDPVAHTFTRQELGPATGDVRFVATAFGGFAASWHAPDGTVMGRGYDEYAYGGDIPGWYGPARQLAGDLVGVTAGGELIVQASGGGQQLYTLVGASSAPTTPPGGATSGDDVLQAGPGNTRLFGGDGNDTIIGGGGDDYLRGEAGDDRIAGGDGFDDVHGNMGNDTVSGGEGPDWVVGGKDDDLLFGDGGHDVVLGNMGNDTVVGGVGNDVVRGGKDDDVVKGEDGDDWISGDRGTDTLTGGAGADIFHTFDGAGTDRVTDFSVAEGDRVYLLPGTHYTVAQSGADTVVTVTDGEGGQLILVGVQMSTLPDGWIFGA